MCKYLFQLRSLPVLTRDARIHARARVYGECKRRISGLYASKAEFSLIGGVKRPTAMATARGSDLVAKTQC